MDRAQIVELYFITDIGNLPSIVEAGILCHRDAKRKPHRSIANESVQRIRAEKAVPQGGKLHDYANVYIWPRNAMLSAVRDLYDQLCILAVDPSILDLPGAVVTDGNAAKHWAGFYDVDEGLPLLDAEVIFATWWIHADDPVATARHKAAMMAEVLVADRIEAKFMRRVYVQNTTAAAAIEALELELEVVIRPNLFL